MLKQFLYAYHSVESIPKVLSVQPKSLKVLDMLYKRVIANNLNHDIKKVLVSIGTRGVGYKYLPWW